MAVFCFFIQLSHIKDITAVWGRVFLWSLALRFGLIVAPWE